MNEGVIDAGTELEERESAEREASGALEGERGASDVGTHRRALVPGTKSFLFVMVGVIGILAALFTWKALKMKGEDGAATKTVPREQPRIQSVLPALNRNTPLPSAQRVQMASPGAATLASGDGSDARHAADSAAVPPSGGGTAGWEGQPQTGPAAVRARRLAATFAEDSGDRGGGERATAGPAPENGASRTSELAQKLETVRLSGSAAGVLPDRNYLITQGTMLDCALETRIVTTVPGMVSCHLTRDVYSTNGHVVLLDRGSKVVGSYQGAMQQGQARIFIVWTRVETPQGVIVNLDSPGTGPLGEAGVGGEVDGHFFERFGGAILLSMVSDFSSAAAQSLADSQGSTNITFSATQSAAQNMAAEALRNTINIPPTLYKDQGSRVAIFVARDLDFRSVYDLRPR